MGTSEKDRRVGQVIFKKYEKAQGTGVAQTWYRQPVPCAFQDLPIKS